MDTLRHNRDIVLILFFFVVLGLAYSVVNPLHEATDELRHYRFVRYIVANQALPVQGAEPCRSQSHHPPLYYAIGALATAWIDTGREVCAKPPENPFWAYRYADVGVDNKNLYLHSPGEAFPWRGEALAAHLLRALNVLIGAVTVWLTWATGRAIWPERRALAAGGAAFVAFNPMFLYMAGAINNDVIAAASGAAVLYALVRLYQDPAGLSLRWGLILGLLYGVALLSKFNMAVLALLIAGVVTVVAWQRGQWRGWFQVGALTVVVAGLVAGWWFLRNQSLYGDPTGFTAVTELWGVRDPRESIPLAISELPHAWSTLWGRFGYGQIPLPDAYYTALGWLVGVALLGVPLPLLQRRKAPWALILLLLANVALMFAVLFNYMLVSPAGAMGRFFFPGLPALAMLVFFGISRWLLAGADMFGRIRGREPEDPMIDEERLLVPLAFVTNVVMAGFALVALFGYLGPAYARPPAYAATTELPNRVDARFDALATLRAYELSTRDLRPGEPLTVDLYWEVDSEPPGDYVLFLHLIDDTGTVVAQRDTHPGTGTFPTRFWQRGERFVDSVTLYLPETAYTPDTATLYVGMYAPTYRLQVSGPQGDLWGDALALGEIRLQPATQLYPRADEIPNPLWQNFAGEMRLIGFDYDARTVVPGGELKVKVYWEPLADAAPMYVQRVQLVDGAGRVWANDRDPIATEDGGILEVTQTLAPDGDVPLGTYRVRVTLLDADGKTRTHIVGEDGHLIDDELDLAPIRVVPPAKTEVGDDGDSDSTR